MNFYTHLRDISHSDDLVLKMQSWAKENFQFKTNKNLKINVYMTKTVPRGNLANKTFECHIMAEAPWLQKNIFVKCTDDEFWSAYTQCSKKLTQRIQKITQRIHKNKVHQSKDESRGVWKENINSETF